VGMHADGGGLYLQVTRTASGQLNKSWLYRYVVARKADGAGLAGRGQARRRQAEG
jgi:hypothetical protein